jgi:alkylation response protein AidB-like acyl-CoA dehydrogenase
VQIHDTWEVIGMRGTGSHDFSVTEVFVPERHTVEYAIGASPRNPAPEYRLFLLQFIAQATLMLGIAERALDEFRELSSAKTPRGSTAVLREQPAVQRDFGRAWASVHAARAYLYDAATAAYEASLGVSDVSLELRAELRLAMSHAAQSSLAAVNLIHDAAGASAIWSSSAIERCFRDLHTAKAHVTLGPGGQLDAAKVLLGLEPGPTFG